MARSGSPNLPSLPGLPNLPHQQSYTMGPTNNMAKQYDI